MSAMRAAALCLALTANPAHAETTGRATVIDADTIEVRGERIRLDAIAADVRKGNQRDAILFACAANASHGY